MIKYFKKLFSKEQPAAITKEALKNLLPEDPVIVEAGIYDGSDTEEFAKVFPGAKIYGFECLPHHYNRSVERLRAYPQITVYPFALSDTTQEVDFHVSTMQDEYYGSGSLLAPKLHEQIHPTIKFESTIKVSTITLDEWAQLYNIGKVDFLWLDLQGAEVRALTGADKLLQNVTAIFTEVSLVETYENVPLYDDVKAFLQAKGFHVHKEFLPYKDMGNVLFLK